MKKCWRCAEDVQDEAIACRHCGADLSKYHDPLSSPDKARKSNGCLKWLGIGAIFIFALLILGAIVGPGPDKNQALAGRDRATSGGASSIDDKSKPSFSLRKITADEYAALRDGMTYDAAIAVIGDPGEEVSSSNVAGYRTVMYSWVNFDGSNANAMFQNGELVMKAQFGL